MSERPIQKGDLVMMVHSSHSCADELLGIPFTVTGVFSPAHGRCNRCAEFVSKEPAALGLRFGGIPLSWLKRIDPPALSEDTETEKELIA